MSQLVGFLLLSLLTAAFGGCIEEGKCKCPGVSKCCNPVPQFPGSCACDASSSGWHHDCEVPGDVPTPAPSPAPSEDCVHEGQCRCPGYEQCCNPSTIPGDKSCVCGTGGGDWRTDCARPVGPGPTPTPPTPRPTPTPPPTPSPPHPTPSPTEEECTKIGKCECPGVATCCDPSPTAGNDSCLCGLGPETWHKDCKQPNSNSTTTTTAAPLAIGNDNVMPIMASGALMIILASSAWCLGHGVLRRTRHRAGVERHSQALNIDYEPEDADRYPHRRDVTAPIVMLISVLGSISSVWSCFSMRRAAQNPVDWLVFCIYGASIALSVVTGLVFLLCFLKAKLQSNPKFASYCYHNTSFISRVVVFTAVSPSTAQIMVCNFPGIGATRAPLAPPDVLQLRAFGALIGIVVKCLPQLATLLWSYQRSTECAVKVGSDCLYPSSSSAIFILSSVVIGIEMLQSLVAGLTSCFLLRHYH
eukprot:TRINITY_DN74217_c0_g1_i1.p1 TRINITY_DN74217_c0_g1~~TRINITY_DN74217_c0_g1_i1.p1  ORF type:complete len:472 (+),score=14.72 TRINITY_DN74217_c0_g1_i1:70-1485(+)